MFVTKVKMKYDEYPILQIHWEEFEDKLGWHGNCVIWKSKNEKEKCEHEISLRQTMPLGFINVVFDEHPGAGTWAYSSFEGHGITERDLFWANCYAALAIEDNHRRSVKCKNKK